MNEVDVRYSVPSKYDVAPYGKIYKVMGEHESQELYVQLSEDLNVPFWKPISYLLEKSFNPYLNNDNFILLCLRLYSEKEYKREHYIKLSELLSNSPF